MTLKVSRTYNITIHWSYPVRLTGDDFSHYLEDHQGVYYISRKFGGNETLVYIGKAAKQALGTRVRQHFNALYPSDFTELRGDLYIRLGVVTQPQYFYTKEN